MSKIKSSPSIVINQNISIIRAIQQLEDCKEVGSLIVVDNSKNLKVIGILSDGDIRRFILRIRTFDLKKIKVKDIIKEKKTKVTTVSTSESWFYEIGEARDNNQDLRIRIVPIVENERLVGVLDLVATKDRSRLDAILMEIAYPTIQDDRDNGWLRVESLKKRRENYDTYHIESQIKKYEALAQLDKNEMLAMIAKNRVDLLYMAFKRGYDWVKNFPNPNPDFKEKMKNLANKLDYAITSLLMLYLPMKFLNSNRSFVATTHKYKEKNKSKLNEKDIQHIVCVLGCTGAVELKARIGEALRILKRLIEKKKISPVALVLSGGGKNGQKTEAAIMNGIIKKMNRSEKIKNFLSKNVLLEEDSLDTVGNAVFSTFALLRKKILNFNYETNKFEISNNRNIKIWIVTSDYHAPRALNLFTRIFESDQVEICLSPTNADVLTNVERAKNQFDSEYKANSQTFALEDVISGLSHDIAIGEVFSIFFQLLRKHDLYRDREDFLRDYRKIIEEWLVSRKNGLFSFYES